MTLTQDRTPPHPNPLPKRERELTSVVVIARQPLENRAVTDDLYRRRSVSAAYECGGAAGRPGPAFQKTRKRQRVRVAAKPLADDFSELVQQCNGERAPFHHKVGADLIRSIGVCGVAQSKHAEIASLLAWVLSYAALPDQAVAVAAEALSHLGEDELYLRRRLQSTIMRAGEHDPALTAEQGRIEAQLWSIEH